MLELANYIRARYYRDEFQPFIIYGGILGIGKSAYAIRGLAEALTPKGEPTNFETVKDFILFHPKDVVKKCFDMMETGRREKAFIWDDAGLWLYALEWNHPFVMAFGKYLNVARTNWGSIIFTTPSPTWVFKKLRGFPDALTIKVIKRDDAQNPKKPRRAIGYKHWISADLKRTGVRKIFEDDFYAILPDDFYQWYLPLRDSYAEMAIKIMRAKLKTLLTEEAVELGEVAPETPLS